MRDIRLDENAPIDHPEGPVSISRFGPDRLRIYRKFAAPREALFDAHFTPDLLRLWRHSDTRPLTFCDVSLHPGGTAALAWGEDSTTHMTFQEIDRPARVVYETREGKDAGAAVLSTLLLVPLPGGTLMTQEFWYTSPEAREAAMTGTLETDLEEDYARLEALLLG